MFKKRTQKRVIKISRIGGTEENEYPLVQVKGGGFGCALINTNVFKKMDYPYFQYILYDNGAVLSEDLYFCGRDHLAKIPVFMDTRVKCGHLVRKFQFE